MFVEVQLGIRQRTPTVLSTHFSAVTCEGTGAQVSAPKSVSGPTHRDEANHHDSGGKFCRAAQQHREKADARRNYKGEQHQPASDQLKFQLIAPHSGF
jgi:hypothetical protein